MKSLFGLNTPLLARAFNHPNQRHSYTVALGCYLTFGFDHQQFWEQIDIDFEVTLTGFFSCLEMAKPKPKNPNPGLRVKPETRV